MPWETWNGVYALVERARTGDRDAWTDLHALARPYLLGLAQSLLGPGWPHQTANDLSQDAWLKLCDNIGDFRGGDDDAQTSAVLRAWLGKTATQLAKNYRRDNQAQKRAAPAGILRLGLINEDGSVDGWKANDPPARDPTPSHDERSRERTAMIERALGRIPDPVERQIVALHYLKEWPLQRIAEHLSLTYDQVRSRLNVGRNCLKQELLVHDDDPIQP